MAIQYKVWTEAEDQARNIIDAGKYRAQIASVIRKRTKSGEYEMLEMSMNLTDMSGRQRSLKDWIVLNPDWDWKLRHIARSANVLHHYENQSLDIPHLVGATVTIDVGIKDGDKGKMNNIKDYLVPGNNIGKSDTIDHGALLGNDEIPF